jgi:hypothetical protein
MSPGGGKSNGVKGTKSGGGNGGGKRAGAKGSGAKGGPARPGAPAKPRLAVLVDGVALGDDEARALWVRFSRHMDAHQGDLAGFAASEGFASVVPEHRKGQAVLVITRRRPGDG